MQQDKIIATEGFFGSGPCLFYRAWRAADGDPRAAVAVVHGGGEHSGRYLKFAQAMTPRGYAVYAYDLRGHGKSPGIRGHIGRFADYLADTREFLQFVRGQVPGKKVFLLGHSVGGLIAAVYSLENQDLPGVVLSSPFLSMKLKVPAWKSGMAKLLSLLLPKLTMHNGLSADDLSRDAGVCELYRRDLLVHDMASTRFYTELLAAQQSALAGAGRLKIPLLEIYGTADKIADPEGAKAFFSRAGSADKTLKAYDGYFHEVFNEIGREAAFEDLDRWLRHLL
jgi:lysophospholipase